MVDRTRNVEIREELNQEGVLEKVKRSQERWREELQGMGVERLVGESKKLRWKEEEEEEGGQERNGLIILSNDILMLHANSCSRKNLLY